MSDYGKLDKVMIDIITLDSEACAPCQYMVEAVKNIMPQFEDLVIWREHKIKMKDSVEFMTALFVRNIPTICIDGEIVFVSKIPGRDELIRVIQERLNRKARRFLKRHMAKIIVVGTGDDESEQVKRNVELAVKELGVEMTVDYCTNPADKERYQLDSLPAVITEQTVIKSTGKIPKPEIIKEWIKELRL